MRLKDHGDAITVWLSRVETGNWADGWYGNGSWPLSMLAGNRLKADFDTNGLLDLEIEGRAAPDDLDGNEFNACVSYFVGQRLPQDHPCYFVVVGQFQ